MAESGINRDEGEILHNEVTVFSAKENMFCFFSEPPSLESIALVCVAIRLYGDPDLSKFKFRHSKRKHGENDYFDKLKENAFNNLDEILLPDALKLKISNVIAPIGNQIRRCVYEWEDIFVWKYRCLNGICNEGDSYFWTMHGTIDKVRSLTETISRAKHLDAKEINLDTLFKLSCNYCIEEHVPDLWLKISGEIYELDSIVYTNYSFHIIAYWIAATENKLPTLLGHLRRHDPENIYDSNLSIFENMTSLSVLLRNEIAFKYFWYKLTDQEKTTNLEKWVELLITNLITAYDESNELCSYYLENDEGIPIICILLSHLNVNMRPETILKNHSGKILLSLFYHWPLRRSFLSSIFVMLNFLEVQVYSQIVSTIASKIDEIGTASILLREVWLISPFKFKRAFINFLVDHANVMVYLIRVIDDNTVDMILNYASLIEKRKIAFQMIEKDTFCNFLYSNESAFSKIGTFAFKVLPSKVDVLSFKRCVALKGAEFLSHKRIRKGDFHLFRKMLEWASQSENEIGELKKRINPESIYGSLIHLPEFESANNFINWYFKTEEEIIHFNKSFVHRVQCFDCLRLMSSLYSEGKDGWVQFEKFLSYGFISSKKLTEYKKFLLHGNSFNLDSHEFEFATLFLNWCFDSTDEVNQFKKELLSKSILLYYFEDDIVDWEELKVVLKWFSPLSIEAISELKSVFYDSDFDTDETEAIEKRRTFFELLDSFAEICPFKEECEISK